MEQAFVIELSKDLALEAAKYGKFYELPLADSIIYATTLKYNATLYTLDRHFKGLKNVVEIGSQDQVKYASGMFNDYLTAVSYRKEIEGIYPDAFVVAIKDDKILPLQQALDQIKEITKRDSK